MKSSKISFRQLGTRTRVLLGIAVLIVGTFFIASSRHPDSSGSADDEIKSKIKILTAYQKAARSHDEILSVYNKIAHRQTPGPVGEGGFSFEKIGELARECSVTVVSVKPRLLDKDKGKGAQEAGHILYDVTVRGNGQGILKFLDKVENPELFARVKHFKVSAESRNAEGLLQCVLFVDQLSLS